MTSLPDWLRQQLDEDERIARATDGSLNRNANYTWTAEPVDMPGDDEFYKVTTGRGYRVGTGEYSRSEAAHIALHDPARVLLEIEAKRQMLAEMEVAEQEMDQAAREQDTARYNMVRAKWVALRRIARWEAAVYGSRPGYREDWRP